MCEKMYDPVEEAKNNIWSKIGKTYSKEDAVQVWQSLGQWIGENLIAHRTIKIKNLGVFALSNWKLDTGIRKYSYNNNPIFTISEKLANDYELKQTKVFISEKCPVLLTNYWSVSKMTSFNRAKVEVCIEEVLLALSRLLYEGKDIQFSIQGLGTLGIIKKNVQFDFSMDIIVRIKPTPPIKKIEQCSRRNRTYSPEPYFCPYVNSRNQH